MLCKEVVLDAGLIMNEGDRLDALHALRILDTAPKVGFDDIVRLATRLCDTPVALISFVETDRQWFKARVGFKPCETPIGQSVFSFRVVVSSMRDQLVPGHRSGTLRNNPSAP